MGSISGMLGLGQGSSFSPTAANITNPTSAAQIGTAYTGAQNAMQGQQGLLSALQGQNGLANQTQNYNQLQGVINGTGPNPAQAQLAQATGANSANQAALMAGQRGAGANVGLMARQAAQQGAANQQNSIGQAATLQANQSLNALGQAGTMANTQAANQIGQTNANTSAQQAEQQNLLNAQQGYNTNQVSMQTNMNNVAGQLANTSAQGQQGLVGGLLNSAGPILGKLGGAISSGLSSLGGAAVGGATTIAGGAGDAVGAAAPVALAADGLDVGGAPAQPRMQAPAAFGPQSKFGQFMLAKSNSQGQSQGDQGSTPQSGPAALQQGMTNLGKSLIGGSSPSPSGNGVTTNSDGSYNLGIDTSNTPGGMMPNGYQIGQSSYAKGGKVPALVSPGEVYLPPNKVAQVAAGKNPLAEGKKIPGKPKYPGNDYRNDTVPAKLESGGIVIPNKVLQSKDPAGESARFVAATLAKRKVGRK